jgi:hypothetical protein
MNMVNCLSCIVSLIAAVVIYMYVSDLEKEQCECSKGWKRDVVKYLSIVFMIINVLSMFMSLGLFDGVGNSLKSSAIFPLLSVLYVLVSLVYLCITLVLYIDLTTDKGCGCSHDWKRHSLLYPIIVFLLSLLFAVYMLTMNWSSISKQLAKGKTVKQGSITVFPTKKKTNKK